MAPKIITVIAIVVLVVVAVTNNNTNSICNILNAFSSLGVDVAG